jgi:hypothetical protein
LRLAHDREQSEAGHRALRVFAWQLPRSHELPERAEYLDVEEVRRVQRAVLTLQVSGDDAAERCLGDQLDGRGRVEDEHPYSPLLARTISAADGRNGL